MMGFPLQYALYHVFTSMTQRMLQSVSSDQCFGQVLEALCRAEQHAIRSSCRKQRAQKPSTASKRCFLQYRTQISTVFTSYENKFPICHVQITPVLFKKKFFDVFD